jgi:uncharacterized membrane protein
MSTETSTERRHVPLSRRDVSVMSARNRGRQRAAAGHGEGPTLTVWIYDSALGAAAGEVRLKDLKERNALLLHDAVTVTWIPGVHLPRIGHLRYETSAGAARDSVLGGLVGLIFLAPPTEEEGGGSMTSLAQGLRGIGIDQTFLEEFKAQLRPDTSALLVLSGHENLDEVRPVIERGLARGDVALMHVQLPHGALEILREAVRGLQTP